MVEVMYCTREDVKSALDVPETGRADAQIDREIQASSRGIEGELHRYFYPLAATQTFDYPDHQYSLPWRLWLDDWELTSFSQVTAAGQDITSSVIARPDGALLRSEPYDHLEINLASSAMFASGSTYQRAISVTGVFGYSADEAPGGSMVTAFADTTGTTGTVSDSSQVGVGSILRIDTERMIITGRAMAATGQTITNSPTAAANQNTIGIQSGTAVNPGETIQVDAEQMYVQSVTGNNLTVIRNWNGTVLAGHTAGAAVYAPRQVTVTRAALGTVAATHAVNAAINVHQVPSLIRDLCVAETLSTLTQARRGYAMPLKRGGSGNTPGNALELATALTDYRERAMKRYARLRTLTAARFI